MSISAEEKVCYLREAAIVLAKVEVASSSLVARSKNRENGEPRRFLLSGDIAKW